MCDCNQLIVLKAPFLILLTMIMIQFNFTLIETIQNSTENTGNLVINL